MPDEPQNEANDTSKTDSSASEACTRSGTFALTLSVVLFALVPAWVHRPSEIALGRYLDYRFALASDIERLDANPLWKIYKDSNPLAESMPLSRLPSQVSWVFRSNSSDDGSAQKKPSQLRPTDPTDRRPPPPTGLTATTIVDLPEIPALLETVKQLNNSDLLTDSREYSNFFSFSIARWVQSRNNLIYRNAVVDGCATRAIERPHKFSFSLVYTPEIEPEVLLACLKLTDLRDLAKFEQPVMTNPDQIGGHIGRDVDLSPGSLPRAPQTATLVTQALLFFVLIYFGAFTNEAILSQSFPAPGTLFGAFSKSQLTLRVFAFGLFIPPVASLSAAITSKRLLIWLGTICICVAVRSIFITLNCKGYWDGLRKSRKTM